MFIILLFILGFKFITGEDISNKSIGWLLTLLFPGKGLLFILVFTFVGAGFTFENISNISSTLFTLGSGSIFSLF